MLWESFNPAWLAYASYLVGGVLIAATSWIDDVRPLPYRLRIAVHLLAAFILIYGAGYWRLVELPLLGRISLGWLGAPLTLLWVVGLTNAYNFMDGIDGLAGSQAVVAGLAWALLGWWQDQTGVLLLGLLIASASLGFLGHNWSPAHIFMGDVGSAFLGYSFAAMAVLAAQSEPRLALAGVLVVWVFLFDTAFTLARRWRLGENIFTPHRSHLYQRLVITGHSHQSVTLLYLALAILGTLAALAWRFFPYLVDVALLAVFPFCAFGLWRYVKEQEQRYAQAHAEPAAPPATAAVDDSYSAA